MNLYDINGNKIDISSGESVEQKLAALKYHFNTTEGANTWTIYNHFNLFVLAHLSDIHNDTIRYNNFMSFMNKHKNYINAGIVTGDIIDRATVAELNTMVAQEVYNIDLLKSVGNHEKYWDGTTLPDAQIYNNWNLVTNTGKLYYYKDYPAYKIRIICIDPYDPIIGDSHYSQTQIDWFINTLKSAKTNDYTVIVARHNPEGGYYNLTPNDKGFFQRWYQWADIGSLYNNGTLIEDIIDAFKRGTSINQTYTFTDGTASVTVNTSFDGAGSFACYVCGHYHGDFTGYSAAHPDQLYLNVACGVYETDDMRPGTSCYTVSDMPRKPEEDLRQLFNVYAFDLKNHFIKVMRIGATINDMMQERDIAVYDF